MVDRRATSAGLTRGETGARSCSFATRRRGVDGATEQFRRQERLHAVGTNHQADFLDLTGIFLAGARLRSASLQSCMLLNANLAGADLTLVKLEGSDLNNANLAGATLCDVNFRGVKIYGAHFDGADLSRSFFEGVIAPQGSFPNANFARANLKSADFTGADLRRAKFVGALMRQETQTFLEREIFDTLCEAKVQRQGVELQRPHGAIL